MADVVKAVTLVQESGFVLFKKRRGGEGFSRLFSDIHTNDKKPGRLMDSMRMKSFQTAAIFWLAILLTRLAAAQLGAA